MDAGPAERLRTPRTWPRSTKRQPRWVPGDEIDSLLRELGADEAWGREIAAERAAFDVADPWEHIE